VNRSDAIRKIESYFDEGGFRADLQRRVAFRTESQVPEQRSELYRYLNDEITLSLEAIDFTCRIYHNPREHGGPRYPASFIILRG